MVELGGCAPFWDGAPDVCVRLQRVVEGWRQVGCVARILSVRRAELPAVQRRSSALALIGVVGNMISQRRRAVLDYSVDSRALRAGAVGRMSSIRWIRFHWGHGRRERAVVCPGCTVEFIQSGL